MSGGGAEETRGTLIVERFSWYGRETLRPACPLSEGFARLLGQKTLTPEDVERIKALGFVVKTKEVRL